MKTRAETADGLRAALPGYALEHLDAALAGDPEAGWRLLFAPNRLHGTSLLLTPSAC